MRRHRTPFALLPVVVLALVLAGCPGQRPSASRSGSSVAAAEPATLDLPDLQRRFEANKAAGKVTLVMFWATWCPACKSELPVLERLRAAYPESGLDVLAISVDDGRATMRNFLAAHPLRVPVYLSRPVVGAQYGVSAIPAILILDRAGRRAFKNSGAYPFQMLDAVIKPLVKAS